MSSQLQCRSNKDVVSSHIDNNFVHYDDSMSIAPLFQGGPTLSSDHVEYTSISVKTTHTVLPYSSLAVAGNTFHY